MPFRALHDEYGRNSRRNWPKVSRGVATDVAITLVGVKMQQVELLLLGTVVAWFGFGSVFSGTMRTVLPLAPPNERAELLSTFYVES